MKVDTKKGVVTLTSQNKEEAIALFTFSLGDEAWVAEGTPDLIIPPVKRRRRRASLIKCEICGKKCRGKKGLGLHKSWVHNIKPPNYQEKKAARERKALKEANAIWNS